MSSSFRRSRNRNVLSERKENERKIFVFSFWKSDLFLSDEWRISLSAFFPINDLLKMLLRAVDVLDIYVEPFIHSGFRLPNQPYSYYYRSLFSLHNETLSVWIHLLGTFILIGQVYQHLFELNCNSSILWIYLIYNCCGACVMLLCSAQAHLFHSRTLADHLRSFYLDYFGINFYGFTSGIILRKFSHQRKVFDENNGKVVRLFSLLTNSACPTQNSIASIDILKRKMSEHLREILSLVLSMIGILERCIDFDTSKYSREKVH